MKNTQNTLSKPNSPKVTVAESLKCDIINQVLNGEYNLEHLSASDYYRLEVKEPKTFYTIMPDMGTEMENKIYELAEMNDIVVPQGKDLNEPEFFKYIQNKFPEYFI
jgi:hypothetical protein